MEGRLVGWLVGACVFTSDVKSLFVGSSRVPLRSIQALVPRYASEDFSDPFISPRKQGAFVFSFAKMQHRYLRRCRWYSFEVAKSHPLTLVPIRPAILPIHLPPPASRCHNRHSYRRIHLYHDFCHYYLFIHLHLHLLPLHLLQLSLPLLRYPHPQPPQLYARACAAASASLAATFSLAVDARVSFCVCDFCASNCFPSLPFPCAALSRSWKGG